MILEHKHIKKNMHKVFIHKEALMGMPTGKRQFGRSRLRWHTHLTKTLVKLEEESGWQKTGLRGRG